MPPIFPPALAMAVSSRANVPKCWLFITRTVREIFVSQLIFTSIKNEF
jgi:hypothetical protein